MHLGLSRHEPLVHHDVRAPSTRTPQLRSPRILAAVPGPLVYHRGWVFWCACHKRRDRTTRALSSSLRLEPRTPSLTCCLHPRGDGTCLPGGQCACIRDRIL